MPKGHDFTRDPCPYIIVNDIGFGFVLGAVLGTIGNTYKGYRNSPRGERMAGIMSAVKTKAPITAGNFAVWSGMFNAFECTLIHYREKEDAWNSVLSGAGTGALLAARAGPTTMIVSGLFGGVLLGLMEGVGVMFSKWQTTEMPNYADQAPQQSPPAQSSGDSTPQKRGLFNAGRFGFQA